MWSRPEPRLRHPAQLHGAALRGIQVARRVRARAARAARRAEPELERRRTPTRRAAPAHRCEPARLPVPADAAADSDRHARPVPAHHRHPLQRRVHSTEARYWN